MTKTIVTTRESAKYHVDENCHLWLRGRINSEDRGHELHEVLRISEADAQRMDKLPCKGCGGRT